MILFHLDYEQSMWDKGQGFGGENGVAKEAFNFRNKVYLLSRCYFIILNIKFIIWYKLLECLINMQFQSHIYIYIYISIEKTHSIVKKLLLE